MGLSHGKLYEENFQKASMYCGAVAVGTCSVWCWPYGFEFVSYTFLA